MDGFYHRYNITWAGERFVEIPIANAYLEGVPADQVLEVGNVLKHYGQYPHAVVDKYESGPGVENCDIVEYSAPGKFKLIISISTFEHIGFDDDSSAGSKDKILTAVEHCRRLLAPGGVFVITVPLGYNPDLDLIVERDLWHASKLRCLKRVGFSDWEECDLPEARRHPYRQKFPYANSLVVAEFSSAL